MKTFRKIKNKKQGIIILQVMVFGAVAVMMIGALASWTAITTKAGRTALNREQALQSSEAGIEYYRWHLSHAPSDYQDGTGVAGPYTHSLKDKDGNIVGNYSLTITPPNSGSTLVKIKSAGSAIGEPSFQRKIISQVAKPSIAEHAFAGNNTMRFGQGTEIFGTIHSNGGIRFDGLAHNTVTSSAGTYDDPDHNGGVELGVHTHVNPPPGSGVNNTYRGAETNPNAIPVRTDVFEAGRKVNQPVIDFSGFTADIANLKTEAQASGFYLDAAGAGFVGYHIVLKTNDTFDLYKINSWVALGNCVSTSLSWSINTEVLQGNYPFPSNGVIFIQDNVVINGQINGARLTIAAALLPVPVAAQYKNILINNDLTYTNYDGTDSLGLVGQGGVLVGMISEDDLKIDGALMAQFNNVGRPSYTGANCNYKNRALLTLYGMIASYTRYGFAYTDGTGYAIRNINYDANLLYAPPPSFPLTSDQYQVLSWQEVVN